MKTINENSIPLPQADARPADSQESTRSCSTGPAVELSVCIMEQKCSYCESDGPFLGQKAINRFIRRHLIFPKTPICLKCYQGVVQKKIPVTCNPKDL